MTARTLPTTSPTAKHPPPKGLLQAVWCAIIATRDIYHGEALRTAYSCDARPEHAALPADFDESPTQSQPTQQAEAGCAPSQGREHPPPPLSVDPPQVERGDGCCS
jgi:hypothetical protein